MYQQNWWLQRNRQRFVPKAFAAGHMNRMSISTWWRSKPAEMLPFCALGLVRVELVRKTSGDPTRWRTLSRVSKAAHLHQSVPEATI
jgi:hypothetical protein